QDLAVSITEIGERLTALQDFHLEAVGLRLAAQDQVQPPRVHGPQPRPLPMRSAKGRRSDQSIRVAAPYPVHPGPAVPVSLPRRYSGASRSALVPRDRALAIVLGPLPAGRGPRARAALPSHGAPPLAPGGLRHRGGGPRRWPGRPSERRTTTY